jgi:hypothetical protein
MILTFFQFVGHVGMATAVVQDETGNESAIQCRATLVKNLNAVQVNRASYHSKWFNSVPPRPAHL